MSRQSRTQGVDWRIKATAGTGVAVGVSMILLGMEPRLFLVGLVVVAVAAVGFLTADVGDVTAPVTWRDHGTGASASARPDQRVQALRARLRSPARQRLIPEKVDPNRPQPVDEVVNTLLRSIDDHLLFEHHIDRSLEPAAAAAVLGPELTRFVSDPAAQRSMTGRRGLARTVALIEDL